MSHITKVKTKLTDLNTAAKAIQYLGLSYATNQSARLYQSSEKFPLVIKLPRYDIGLTLQSGNVELKADSMAYWQLNQEASLQKYLKKQKHVTQDVFVSILQQAYNIVNATELATKMGHKMIVTDPDDQGIIHAQIQVI